MKTNIVIIMTTKIHYCFWSKFLAEYNLITLLHQYFSFMFCLANKANNSKRDTFNKVIYIIKISTIFNIFA